MARAPKKPPGRTGKIPAGAAPAPMRGTPPAATPAKKSVPQRDGLAKATRDLAKKRGLL